MPIYLNEKNLSPLEDTTALAVTRLCADDLKKRFGVYGDFYQIMLGGNDYACRSVLELIAHEQTPEDPNGIQFMNPDLLVVMMNPGSSKPQVPCFVPRRVQGDGTEERPQRVKTRPDNTQYQIMRIMAARGFQHARILNLSDLREPKSPMLMPKLEFLHSIPGGDRHSVFCNDRDLERQRLMGPYGAIPVLAGWGRHKKLLSLATLCVEKLHGWRVIGLPVDDRGLFYAHPSPMLQRGKDLWLTAVLKQLS